MTSILIFQNSLLSTHEEPIEPSTIIDERATSYDEIYGASNWAVTPTSDLPADFSVDTYTIIDNTLVPASPEIIAERRAIQALATHAATRQARQQRYDSEAVTSLYWNWQESGAKADKLKWLAAKEAIRQELPYATEAEQHEKGGEV